MAHRGGQRPTNQQLVYRWRTTEALIIIYTICGVPYHSYSIMGLKTLF